MVVLIVLGTFLLAIFGAGIMTSYVTSILKQTDGADSGARAIRLFAGILTFCGYGYWSVYKTAEYWMSSTSDDIGPLGMIIPLALPWVLIIIAYIKNGNQNNK